MEDIYFKNDEYWKKHINKKLELEPRTGFEPARP